jgi:hypothetical protein
MNKKLLQFSFDYCRCCLWGNNGAVEYHLLPISINLINELNDLCDEFDSHISWNDGSSQWTKEMYLDFFERAALIYEKLKTELNSDYIVISGLDEDKKTYMENFI